MKSSERVFIGQIESTWRRLITFVKKTCPICNLNRIAAQAMTEGPNDEEAKYFKTLRDGARARTQLKWNVFDRDDPNVTVVDDKGNEVKKKGLKIASIGTEAMEDIEGIFEQIVLFGDAEPMTESPLVHASPVPTLPTIWIVICVSVANKVHKPEVGAVTVA